MMKDRKEAEETVDDDADYDDYGNEEEELTISEEGERLRGQIWRKKASREREERRDAGDPNPKTEQKEKDNPNPKPTE